MARKIPTWTILLAFLAGIAAVFIGVSFAQEVRRRVALQQHVRQLEQDIQIREQRISSLQQFTEYLKTDAYQERAAREKLSYQRPGEHVIVVPEGGRVLEATAEDHSKASPQFSVSIPRQWWDWYFGGAR